MNDKSNWSPEIRRIATSTTVPEFEGRSVKNEWNHALIPIKKPVERNKMLSGNVKVAGDIPLRK